MSSRTSVAEAQSSHSTPTPLKRKRDKHEKPIVIPPDDSSVEQTYFIDDLAMQRAVDLFTQNKWINDECVNAVLEIFNPDPSLFYVVSTHLATQKEHAEASTPRIKDAAGLPNKLVIPLHLSSMSHWALAVYDRREKRCILYDPMGSKKYLELALRMVHAFLRRNNIWEADMTIGPDPFPSMRQTDSTNCGVFVIAAALHLFQDREVSSFTPELWRDLLAAYFCTGSEMTREGTASWLANVAKPIDSDRAHGVLIERKLADVEAANTASSRVNGCVKEARLLLEMVDARIPVLEKQEEERHSLLEISLWSSRMPGGAEALLSGIVSAQKESANRQLKALPRAVKGGIRQLYVMRKHCLGTIDHCRTVASELKQRKNEILQKVMLAYLDLGSRLVALEEGEKHDVGDSPSTERTGEMSRKPGDRN